MPRLPLRRPVIQPGRKWQKAENIMAESRNININVPVLARVEGEGALELSIQNNHIDALRLRIYEPPRLFEKFLEGRS